MMCTGSFFSSMKKFSINSSSFKGVCHLKKVQNEESAMSCHSLIALVIQYLSFKQQHREFLNDVYRANKQWIGYYLGLTKPVLFI